jgi:fatty-acyl-CoA synthase
MLEGMMIADPETMQELPWDGQSIGECMMRGNIVMAGYLKNPKTTEQTLRGGWYHSGDLCVRHPDGYIEVKDRLKDIIISGGENIPTLELESILYRHPDIFEAAVVAKPDPKWGETPCAFVDLKPGAKLVTEADIIAYCKANMAGYKVPKSVVFGPLPKTLTGKIQKYVLRDRAKALAEAENNPEKGQKVA